MSPRRLTQRRESRGRQLVAVLVTLFAFTPGGDVWAQPQSPEQAKCLTGLAKAAQKVVKAQGKAIDACVIELAENGGNHFACLTADPKGKVAKAEEKLLAIDQKFCSTAPDFAYGAPTTLAAAAKAHRIAVVEWTTTLSELDAGDARCARTYLRGVSKVLALKLRGFGRCLKDGLASGAIQSAAEVEACFAAFLADNDAKIGHLLDKLDGKLSGSCLPLCFDTVRNCAEQSTACRACEIMRIGGGLSIDCDLFDDGQEYTCYAACGDTDIGSFPPEECDDGNRLSGDGCDLTCVVSGCRNVVAAPDEFCDGIYYYEYGGRCLGGEADGLPCGLNAECPGGYCSSCPWRGNCNDSCSACNEAVCIDWGYGPELAIGTCIGSPCAWIPFVDCDDPQYVGYSGNCFVDGQCVVTTAEDCEEYEGVLGSCVIGL